MKHKTHTFAKEEKIEETIVEYMTSPVMNVPAETTIFEVSQLMAEKNIGSVLVKSGEEFVGIITERDLTRKVIGQGLDPKTTPVTEANQFMAKHRIRHLAVTVEGKIEGIISVKDLVAFYANPRLRH